MTTQLRIYKIRPGKMDDFVRIWQEGVVPLRQKHGFRVDGAWIVPERYQFVWLCSYDGPEDWETKDRAYYTAPERAALDPDPASLLEEINTTFVTSAMPAG